MTMTLAIVLVAALPKFSEHWSRLRVERTAFELGQRLRGARSLAVSLGRPIVWTWDAEQRRGWLNTLDEQDALQPVTGRLGQPVEPPEGILVTMTKDQQVIDRIHFFPDGTSESISIAVGSDGKAAFAITVDAMTATVFIGRPSDSDDER